MQIDPCRRFVLGATIEDTSMRLWFCNRSMVIASEQFDINRVCPIIVFYYHVLIVRVTGNENIDQTNIMPRICGKC